jgi:ATP-dependent Clp protease ATP-binding subunit ClpA
MFERFTDRARRAVVLSQDEARRLDHDYIGTEHLLLGLVGVDDGVSGRALAAEGVEIAAARAKAEEIVGRGTHSPDGHIPFTPRAKKVLELGLRESMALKHNYIGTEHVLLGLIREGEGVGCQILASLGVDFVALEARVKAMIGSPARADVPSPSFLRRIGFGRRGAQGPVLTTVLEPAGVDMPVLRRFTDDASQVAMVAGAEAQAAGRTGVGEEHVLLAMAQLSPGRARGAAALAAVGVSADRVRESIEGLGLSEVATAPVPSGAPAASCLGLYEYALVEAVIAGRDDIDSGDLLLGFVRRAERGEGHAASVLEALGTTPAAIRAAVAAVAPGEDVDEDEDRAPGSEEG